MNFISKLFNRQSDGSGPVDPIDAFWAWWRLASVELAAAYESGRKPGAELIDAISEHVHAMDTGLAWETGPGKNSDNHFALSSEGNPALRVLTQRWLSRAPQPSKSWEYYPARQGGGAGSRSILCIGEREFCYSDFRLALERDDGRAAVNVVVFHPHFAQMSEQERLQPAFLFLDDVLGEDCVTSWIGTVDVADEGTATDASAAALADMVGALREDWNDEIVSLIKGTRDGSPLLAMMRLGLKRLDHLLQDYHLELALTVREPGDNGLPSGEEVAELNELEDGLIDTLGHRAIWIGHETCSGKRIIHFHADANAALRDEMTRYCRVNGQWEIDLLVTHDPGWHILKRYCQPRVPD